MNSLARGFATFALLGAVAIGAQATPVDLDAGAPGSPVLLAQNLPNSNNNPYNSPTRRANPNSMQGTQPSTPPVRGPTTAPTPRPPTLENGGIGNGYPRNTTPPKAIDPRPVTPPRDSNTR
ncbi:hypothetical protein BK634_18325 [Pseudomonas chlororaphis]|jgi:hypothetical protein|nr:hypothetical protein BK634_18325 [Pseudomonas chlororaphis]WEK07257.1 MAG: hypothetical protein P0Y51_18245 [Pseudomonas sp.]